MSASLDATRRSDAYERALLRIEDDLAQWAEYHRSGFDDGLTTTHCASAESHYVSTDLWLDDDDIRPEIDESEADRIDAAWRNLTRVQRSVLNVHYIRHGAHTRDPNDERLIRKGARVLRYTPRLFLEHLMSARSALVRLTSG